jgi:Fe-S-cluster-containing dehydrogenase component
MACTSCHHKHKALDAFTLGQQLHHRDYATMQQRKQDNATQRNAIARTLPAKIRFCHSSSAPPVVVCLTSAGLKSHKSGMLF